MKKHRFTLIELMVVIGIIFILAGLLLPVLGHARKKAKDVNCVSNQKQIGISLMTYQADYDGLPYAVSNAEWGTAPEKWITTAEYLDPWDNRWTSVYYNVFLQGAGYLTDKSIFVCPLYGAK